jgi:membrane protein DedA with SNARE-associated domain
MTGKATARATKRSMGSGAALAVLRVAVLLLVVGVSLYIFSVRAEAGKWASYGYAGIFVISVLANATVLLPAPGIALVFALGGVLSPPLVSLAAGAGAAVGELSAYGAGFSGQAVFERTSLYERLVAWMRKYGALTTFVLAAVPNPFFDLAGMAAGAMRMPLRKFFLWCLAGKIVKMLIFAYSGAYAGGWLSNIMK